MVVVAEQFSANTKFLPVDFRNYILTNPLFQQFFLWLLSRPQQDKAKEVACTQTAIWRIPTNAVGYAGRTENIVLLEAPETQNTELIQEAEAEAKVDAEKPRPIFTEGPRLAES